MPLNDQLPETYRCILHDEHPLRVGALAHPARWNFNDPESPFKNWYVWRIVEVKPRTYYAQAEGGTLRIKLTPRQARHLTVMPFYSERLRLYDYPDEMRRLLDLGVGGYFYEGSHVRKGCMLLAYECPRGTGAVTLTPDVVADIERRPEMLKPLLEQFIWCQQHPRKADALIWRNTQGTEPFGQWPALLTPKELDAEAKEALPAYRDYQKKHPRHPGIKKAIRGLVNGTGVSTTV